MRQGTALEGKNLLPFREILFFKNIYHTHKYKHFKPMEICHLGQNIFISSFTGIFFSDLGSGGRKKNNKKL